MRGGEGVVLSGKVGAFALLLLALGGCVRPDDVTAPKVLDIRRINDAVGTIKGPFSITVLFNEDMIGFSSGADIAVSNSLIPGTPRANSPQSYTVTITPEPGQNGVHATVTVPASVASDASGNGNVAAGRMIEVFVDNVAPALGRVYGEGGYYRVGDEIKLAVSFGEEVTVAGSPVLCLNLATNPASDDSQLRAINCGSKARYGGSCPTPPEPTEGEPPSIFAFKHCHVFSYAVVAGDADGDGVRVLEVALEGGRIRDGVGHEFNALFSPVALEHIRIDTTAPEVKRQQGGEGEQAKLLVALEDDGQVKGEKTWDWICQDVSLCTYRSKVTVSPSENSFSADDEYTPETSFTRDWGTGTFWFHVQARDLAGNESAVVSVSALLDNTPPPTPNTLTLLVPSTVSAAARGNVREITIRVLGGNGESVFLYTGPECIQRVGAGDVTNGRADIALSLPVDGDYHFYARGVDPLGNVSGCTDEGHKLSYLLDTTLPDRPSRPNSLVLMAPETPLGDASGNDNTPTVRVGGDDGHRVQLFTDATCSGTAKVGEALVVNSYGDITTNVLSVEQEYSFYAKAVDDANNESECSLDRVRYTLDRSIISVEVAQAAGGTGRVNGAFNIVITFSGGVVNFIAGNMVVVGGELSNFVGSGRDYTATVTPNAQVDAVTVTVPAGMAQDAGGGVQVNRVGRLAVTVDWHAPRLVSVSASPERYREGETILFKAVLSEDVTLAGTPRLGLRVGSDSTLFATYQGGSGRTYTFHYTVLRGHEDSEGVGVRGIILGAGDSIGDVAGNAFDAGFTLLKLAGVIVDTTAPGVEGLTSDAVSTRSKTWNWRCSEALCLFRHCITDSSSHPFAVSGSCESAVYGPATTATHARGQGTFWLHVQARDGVGLESSVVSVSAILDTTPPEPPSALALTNPAPPPSYGKVSTPTITVGGVATDTIVLFSDSLCSQSREVVRGVVAPSSTQVALTLPALTEGEYHFYARANDIAGNVSACSRTAVNYVFDGTAPASPGLSWVVSFSSPNTVRAPRVVVDTLEAASVVKIYSDACSTEIVSLAISGDDDNNLETVSLPVLGAEGSYSFYARSIDRAGNQSPCSAPLGYTLNTQFLLDKVSAGGAGGMGHSCAVMANGEVRCWGSGERGQLGDDSSGNDYTQSAPVPVVASDGGGVALSGIVQVSSGGDYACALYRGGTVGCWGSGERGQLGNGQGSSGYFVDHPVSVVRVGGEGLGSVVQVSAGREHACVLTAGGGVKCWGSGKQGQLGDDSDRVGALLEARDFEPHPVDVVNEDNVDQTNSVHHLRGMVQISSGRDHSCGLSRAGGEVWCWGNGGYGQLGQGE